MSISPELARPIERGLARRLVFYLHHMFPPFATLPYMCAFALAAYLSLQALQTAGPLIITWRAAAGALSVFLFAVLLRVNDEFKDAETDRALAAAGDPRYRDRPIVTGAVTEADLEILRAVVIVALLGSTCHSAYRMPSRPLLSPSSSCGCLRTGSSGRRSRGAWFWPC